MSYFYHLFFSLIKRDPQSLKKTIQGLLLFLFLLLVVSCTPKSTLPTNRPPDFTLLYENNGGLFPLNEEIYLSTNESYFKSTHLNAESGYPITLTEAQLDQLYATLRHSRFDLIETYEQDILDRGGLSISITANGQKYQVENSGINFISYKWEEEWDQIIGMVNWLTEEAAQQAEHPFLLQLDQSLLDRDSSLYLNMIPLDQQPTIKLDLIPGQYYLKIQLNDPPFTYSEFLITHPTDTTLTLSYAQNNLSLKGK